ncbi:hypothetical protein ACTFIZ_000166 [Dictyostelium cf. discoideum]
METLPFDSTIQISYGNLIAFSFILMACCLLIPSSFFYYKIKKIDQDTKRKYKKIKKIQYSIINENSQRFVQPPQPQTPQPPQQFSPTIVQTTVELQQQEQQEQKEQQEKQEPQEQLKETSISKLNEYLVQLQQNEKPQLNSSQSSIKTEVHEVSNIDILKNNEPIYEENFLNEKLTPNQIIKTSSNHVLGPSSIMNQSQENTFYFYKENLPKNYTPLSVCVEKQTNLSSNIDTNYNNINIINNNKMVEIDNDTPFHWENGSKIKFKQGFKDQLLINGNTSIIPNGITHVIFNDEFNRRIQPGSIPNTVKKIEFGKKFNNGGFGIDDGVFPIGLEELSFQHYFISKKNDAPLPTSLKILKIGCHKTIHHDNASRYSVVGCGIQHSQLLTNFSHLTNLKQVTLGFCFEGTLPQSLLNLNVKIISSPSYKKSSPYYHVIDKNLGCSL